MRARSATIAAIKKSGVISVEAFDSVDHEGIIRCRTTGRTGVTETQHGSCGGLATARIPDPDGIREICFAKRSSLNDKVCVCFARSFVDQDVAVLKV